MNGFGRVIGGHEFMSMFDASAGIKLRRLTI